MKNAVRKRLCSIKKKLELDLAKARIESGAAWRIKIRHRERADRLAALWRLRDQMMISFAMQRQAADSLNSCLAHLQLMASRKSLAEKLYLATFVKED